MASLKTLADLLKEEIKDLYSAEKQLVKALPKMVAAATSPALKKAFADHLAETKTHVTRLEQAAQELGFKPTGKHCKAMEGLLEEGKEAIEEKGEQHLHDALLVSAAQRVEHYEIAAYGTSRAIAKQLKATAVYELLSTSLLDEKKADDGLTKISMKELYPAVISATSAAAK
jgi:ferritin-like metal-binding protein YciE